MSLGISLFLIAVGAVLAFAVSYTTNGVDINAVGWILMVVGFLGLMMYLMFLATFAPFRRSDGVVDDVDTVDHPRGHTRV